jgi:phosphatidylserine decarboxylase
VLTQLFIGLQYVMPQHLLTALIWRLARIRHTATKDFLIRRFIAAFDVDIDDVLLAVPNDFATFNDFFVRELNSEARPIDQQQSTIVSPVDGTVSAAATILENIIFQAKGLDYSLEDLLATDLDEASAFVDGSFATIYLAPYNYHRIHAPLAGELLAARFVPGDLFSVNQATVAKVDGLFRRNERLVMQFKTEHGPAAVIFVGALNVGSITTPWSGEIRPRKQGVVEVLDLSQHSTSVEKGDLLGWFNMGSTVILLLPKGACDWDEDLQAGTTLKVGEVIGQMLHGNQ